MHEDWDYARSYYSGEHDVIFDESYEPVGLALMDMKLEVTVGDESWNTLGGERARPVVATCTHQR